MTEQSKPALPAAKPRVLPSFIIMIEDHGSLRAAHVYRADADLIARLDTEKAQYRAATDQERGIAGLTV